MIIARLTTSEAMRPRLSSMACSWFWPACFANGFLLTAFLALCFCVCGTLTPYFSVTMPLHVSRQSVFCGRFKTVWLGVPCGIFRQGHKTRRIVLASFSATTVCGIGLGFEGDVMADSGGFGFGFGGMAPQNIGTVTSHDRPSCHSFDIAPPRQCG